MQINLTELANTMMTNINAWLPVATSLLSATATIVCIIVNIVKIKKAAAELKSDETIKQLHIAVENDIAAQKDTKRLLMKYLDEQNKIMRKNNDKSGENRS